MCLKEHVLDTNSTIVRLATFLEHVNVASRTPTSEEPEGQNAGMVNVLAQKDSFDSPASYSRTPFAKQVDRPRMSSGRGACCGPEFSHAHAMAVSRFRTNSDDP